MSAPRLVGRAYGYRDLYLAVLDDVRDWPAAIAEPQPGFVVLTALDTRERSTDEVREFAGKLLDQGCCYACSWGPDADRMDVSFDLEFIHREEAGKLTVGFVMTSAHTDSLDEAIWFAVFAAFPAEGEAVSLLVVDRESASAVEACSTRSGSLTMCSEKKMGQRNDPRLGRSCGAHGASERLFERRFAPLEPAASIHSFSTRPSPSIERFQSVDSSRFVTLAPAIVSVYLAARTMALLCATETRYWLSVSVTVSL